MWQQIFLDVVDVAPLPDLSTPRWLTLGPDKLRAGHRAWRWIREAD